MAAKKPPIIGTAVAAWGDAFNVIGAMPLVVGVGFVIVIAISLLSFALLPAGYPTEAGPWIPVFTVLFSILQALLLAPLAIVVHRYVVLGESTNRYPLEPSNARYMRFVSFAILVKILGIIPGSFESFIPSPQQNPVIAVPGGILILVLFVVVTIVVIRRAILFPAIAVDAPGASWSNARRDTKGSSWRVALIFLCAALPAVIVSIPLWYFTLRSGFGLGGRLMFSLTSSVVEVPTLCAFAAAASHIYLARADTLARPAA